MKSFLHSPLLLMLVSLLFLQASPLFGQAAAPAKVKKIPFHGKIVALDASAGTVTLNGKSARLLHIVPTTTVIDGGGNATTLSAATVGEDVSGSYVKDASGTLTAAKLRIGAKIGSKAASTTPEPAASAPVAAAAATAAPATTPAATAASDSAAASKPATAKKTRFSGKVTAVDAGSITIKARTFAVTSATTITDSTGAAATLADVAVGTKVTGSYEKAADGSMTADTLKIGK